MTTPDIPEDIREKARELAFTFAVADLEEPAIEEIARALLRAREEARAKPLEWTDPEPPNADSHYDHCMATTPFGEYWITWKGWKEHESYDVEGMSEFLAYCHTLPEAKARAQADFEARIAASIREGTKP